jgi:hypothetical protein
MILRGAKQLPREMRNTVEQLRADDSRRYTVSSDKAIRREWRPAAEEIERLRAALQEIATNDERIAEVQRTSHCT